MKRAKTKLRQLCFLSPERHRPPAVPVSTSIAAAEAIAEIAPTLRGAVYAFLAARPVEGATRQEIADQLTVPDKAGNPRRLLLQTVCARVGELKEQHLVWEGDDRRDGRRVVRVRK